MQQFGLSIVIVNWNTCDLLRDCLKALRLGTHPTYEAIVVDNGSTDASPQMMQSEFPQVRLIINPDNRGFSFASNQGIRASQGRYVVLLNSDTIALPVALDGLVDFMEAHPDAGACGPRLLCLDGTPQPYAFGGDPTLGYLLARSLSQLVLRRSLHHWATDEVQQVDWVTGACLMARREAIEQAGLLDESIYMYFEDSDWCLRIRKAGWKVYYDPQVEIVHLGGQSLAKNPRAQRAYYESLRYFYAKHYSRLAQWVIGLLLLIHRKFAITAGLPD